MSIQPLNTFGMADEFFNIYLHTSTSINSDPKNPIWNLSSTGLMGDRYKFFKKCIGVVNFVALDGANDGAVLGEKYLIRNMNNSQSNSTDTLIGGQTNIIYAYQTDEHISNDNAGFPFLLINPFGTQELMITKNNETTPLSTITKHWGIHITYYFYKDN